MAILVKPKKVHCDECGFQGKWHVGSKGAILLQASYGLSHNVSGGGV